jgi:hypothetical protein
MHLESSENIFCNRTIDPTNLQFKTTVLRNQELASLMPTVTQVYCELVQETVKDFSFSSKETKPLIASTILHAGTSL